MVLDVEDADVGRRLMSPPSLHARREIVGGADLVPRSAGVYAWYFRGLDDLVPLHACHEVDHFRLLYVGIAPSRAGSSSTLRSRIRYHCRGNASGSTLRLTLGSLLADQLGLQLRRVGQSGRLHFHEGEERLSEWMGANARVSWVEVEQPWNVEAEVVQALNLPLNIQHNAGHPFVDRLKALRKEHQAIARDLARI